MKKYYQVVIWGIVLSLLLVGCVAFPDTIGTRPTVEDLFHPTTVTPTTAPQVTQPGETQPPYTADSLSGGGCGLSLLYEDIESVTYTGGEMCVSYFLDLEGDHISRDGVGILLFLDGQPQPYRTETDMEYRYMHTVYPESGAKTYVNLFFVPVTGEKGQRHELWATNMVFPYVGARWDGIAGGKTLTAFGSRLLVDFAETPPEAELPQIPDRLISWNTELREVKQSELNSKWTAEDLMNRVDYVLYTEGGSSKSVYYIYGVTGDRPLKLRFEMWGNPLLQWGLVIFIDHVPISVAPEDIMQLQTEVGMKTIVEMDVDISDFGEESIIYAMFVPRNRDAVLADSVYMRPTTHQFLLRAPTWEDFMKDNQ